MTELTHYAPPAAPATVEQHVAPAAVNELVTWADGATAAYKVASQLVQTSFVPQAFRDKPYEATAAILAGQEVGLSPMAALRSFDVIQGTAAPRALTLRAIVQSKGHEIWTVEANTTRAVVRGRRRGSQIVEESVWTMDRAKGLQLTGKDNWRKQPQAMLVARATAECARLVAADAILGVAYAAEELADDQSIDAGPVEQGSRTAEKRTAKRAPVEPPEPESAPEPDLDDAENVSRNGNGDDGQPANEAISSPESATNEPDFANALPDYPPVTHAGNRVNIAENASESAPEDGVSQAQIRKLGALFREAGMTERANALAYTATVIGREVASRNELTKDEASRVIDALDADTRVAPAEPKLPDANDPDDPWTGK